MWTGRHISDPAACFDFVSRRKPDVSSVGATLVAEFTGLPGIEKKSSQLLMWSFAPSFMAPGVHDQKDKDDKTENQQNHRPWFIVPELLNAPGDVFEIHAKLTYTSVAKSEMRASRELG